MVLTVARDLDHRAVAWPEGAVISSLPAHALPQLVRRRRDFRHGRRCRSALRMRASRGALPLSPDSSSVPLARVGCCFERSRRSWRRERSTWATKPCGVASEDASDSCAPFAWLVLEWPRPVAREREAFGAVAEGPRRSSGRPRHPEGGPALEGDPALAQRGQPAGLARCAQLTRAVGTVPFRALRTDGRGPTCRRCPLRPATPGAWAWAFAAHAGAKL